MSPRPQVTTDPEEPLGTDAAALVAMMEQAAPVAPEQAQLPYV